MKNGTEFRINEFTKFYDLLMENAPEGYTPWFFPVKQNDKNPDAPAIIKLALVKSLCCSADWVYRITKEENDRWEKYTEEEKEKRKKPKPQSRCDKCEKTKGSWHGLHARLSKEQCVERIKFGGNLGISAREGDDLVLGDIDDREYLDQVPKNTLSVTSRKRDGLHFFGWDV